VSDDAASRSISVGTATAGPSAAPDFGPDYVAREKIGEGGFGEVWVADQVAPVKRRVAVKVLKAGMDTKSVLARFEAERQALALMDHAHIAKVFDAGETARGLPFFVMELVKGEAITDYCNRCTLTTRERLQLMVPVCHAVQHAHQKGIIHRDLKPSNILVALSDLRPVPKVIDFGIAKATNVALTEKTLYTLQGQLIGTPAYMSPEQAEMSGLDVDARTDVYALGIILYELLAGVPPFSPETLRTAGYSEIQRIIREVEPPRPSTRITERAEEVARLHRTNPRGLRKELREDLDWIVLRAIEKDRTRRYATANAVAADIERHLRHEPVVAGPPTAAYRTRKFVRRHRLGVSLFAAVVLALAALAVTMTVQAGRIARERDRVRVEAETAERVSEFLIDLFEVSDPSEARGNSVTAREILDRGAAEIAGNLGERPVVRARLMGVMGRVYQALGLYEPAAPLTAEALDIRRKQLGEEDPETLEARLELARLELNRGRYDAAESLFAATLADQQRVLGPEDPRTLLTMNSLATLWADQGRYEPAESLQVATLSVQKRVLGEDHRETLRTMSNLARLYWDRGRYDDAERTYVETVAVQRRALGEDHPETLVSKNNLGIVWYVQRRYEEAERIYRETLDARRRVLGEDHPETLRSMNNLALLYHFQQCYDEAEPLYRETLAAKQRVLGPDHPNVMSSLINLGLLLSARGAFGEAEKLYREALELGARVLGEEHPEVLTATLNLANLHVKQGRWSDAEPLYLRTLERQRRVLGESHPETCATMYSLACLAALGGHRERAITWLREASSHGFDDPGALENMDLTSLEGDPEFEAILREIRERIERRAASAGQGT
jgi:non-specific serine/threonine protein kinase/serine/threonine-protein kinase